MNDYSEVEILLVEDNPADAELAVRAFERNHITNKLVHVRDGEEALDLKLPKIDGRGVNSYIVKPVDFDKFVQSVQDIGLYWLLLNQQPRGAAPPEEE
jgi:two-component system, response regulator